MTREMDDHDTTRHPVELLADEFLERIRRGEEPTIAEYLAKHPQYADLIAAVFEPMESMERLSLDRALRQSHSNLPPKKLGDFRVVRELGRGGMGIVYEAVQVSLQRRVALKVIHSTISGNPEHRVRFQRESEAVAKLHHTNIVQVIGNGEEHGLAYYAMQLIDGVPLDQVIQHLRSEDSHGIPEDPYRFTHIAAAKLLLSQANLSPTQKQLDITKEDSSADNPTTEGYFKENDEEEAFLSSQRSQDKTSDRSVEEKSKKLPRSYFRNVARLIADTANAIEYAHRQKILHRDLKPSNLMLDRNGAVWVTDFGLACQLDLDSATRTGELMGTLRYMAPEQLEGRSDARSDVYSLGLCLYELLTLQPAWEMPKQRLVVARKHSQIANARMGRPWIPKDLDIIAAKACASDPAHRYATASELELDLRRFLEDRPITARRASKAEMAIRWGRRNPVLAALATTTTLMLLSTASILAIANRQQQRSLEKIEELYSAAAQNLREKSAALESVQKENARAEANLGLATQAFDQILANIGARGAMSELDDEFESLMEGEHSNLSLSRADVALLELLMSYFDQLSQQNSKDLRMETATARRRVGDLQFRLGNLEEAKIAFREALTSLETLESETEIQSVKRTDISKSKYEIHHAWMRTEGLQGHIAEALDQYHRARKAIEKDPVYAESASGRFDLAKLLNSVGTMSSRLNRGARNRPIAAFGTGGILRPFHEQDSNPPKSELRLKREEELNREALRLLDTLVVQAPSNANYRLALASALRDEVRIARQRGERDEAESAWARSIAILEELTRENPKSNRFAYELAETLSSVSPGKPPDLTPFDRAIALCDQLMEENPFHPDYLALKAKLLSRKSSLFQNAGPMPRRRALDYLSEAVRVQQQLVDRYPDVPSYAMTLVDMFLRLSSLEVRPDRSQEYLDKADSIIQARNQRSIAAPWSRIIEIVRERKKSLQQTAPVGSASDRPQETMRKESSENPPTETATPNSNALKDPR